MTVQDDPLQVIIAQERSDDLRKLKEGGDRFLEEFQLLLSWNTLNKKSA